MTDARSKTGAMSKIVAVLDACVLYPPSLRDLLMRLAVTGVYEPRWTEEIHTEWTRSVLADYPDVTPAQLDRTCRLMNQAIPKGLVLGYESCIPLLSLPDLNDRHVLAAAIASEAAVIVTFNLSDFPAAVLQTYGIKPLHPDVFLSAVFDSETALFLRGLQRHRASLHNPPKTVEEYLQTLRASRLTRLALRLSEYATEI